MNSMMSLGIWIVRRLNSSLLRMSLSFYATSKLNVGFVFTMVSCNVTARGYASNRARFVAVAETKHFRRVMMLCCAAKSLPYLDLLTHRHRVGVYHRPVARFPGFNAPT